MVPDLEELPKWAADNNMGSQSVQELCRSELLRYAGRAGPGAHQDRTRPEPGSACCVLCGVWCVCREHLLKEIELASKRAGLHGFETVKVPHTRTH